MKLRNEVRALLNTVCEGTGVTEDRVGDFQVELGDDPVWVRVIEDPAAIYVFRAVADDVPRSPQVDEFMHDLSKAYVVFRVVWEDGEIFLRADLAATPFAPGQLQRILEDFESVASEVGPQAREWSLS